eukprot:COSAG02_NODE_52865_length_305_cov_0.854369_1_plen_77_part_10
MWHGRVDTGKASAVHRRKRAANRPDGLHGLKTGDLQSLPGNASLCTTCCFTGVLMVCEDPFPALPTPVRITCLDTDA